MLGCKNQSDDKALREQYEGTLLESETATMIYIKRKTKMPVPEMYTYLRP
jgi:hypothetical protein